MQNENRRESSGWEENERQQHIRALGERDSKQKGSLSAERNAKIALNDIYVGNSR